MKKTGIILNQNFIKQEIKSLKGNRLVTLNIYGLLITGEKNFLIYKRDVNLSQDLIGKKIKYKKTDGGLIFESEILKK